MRIPCVSLLPRVVLVAPLALACAPTALDTSGNRASNPQAAVAPLPASEDPLRAAPPPPTKARTHPTEPEPAGHHHPGAAPTPSNSSAGGGPNAPGADGRPDAKATWTCSMHPEIRRNEPGRCPVCGMNLVRVPPSPGRDGGTL